MKYVSAEEIHDAKLKALFCEAAKASGYQTALPTESTRYAYIDEGQAGFCAPISIRKNHSDLESIPFLELYAKLQPALIYVGQHLVKFQKNGIQVGCTHVPTETLRTIVEEAKRTGLL